MNRDKSDQMVTGGAQGHMRWPALLPGVLAAVVINLVPLAGVVWLGWDAFTVVFAYWLEGAVIGLFTLLKIACALPGYDPVPGKSVTYERKGKGVSASFTVTPVSRGSIIPKFIGIYGILMLFYGLALFVFLAREMTFDGAIARLRAVSSGLLTMVLVMLAWHAWAFYSDFIRGPAWARSDSMFHYARPFGRFILLHLIVVIGGVATSALSLPWFYLAVFILLKTGGDVLSALLASAGPWRRANSS